MKKSKLLKCSFKKKRKLVSTAPDTIENKIKNCEYIRKNKMLIEFNDLEPSSVKFLGVKNQTNIKTSSRLLSGKLLMFAKLSLKGFVYSLVELLHFPEENPIAAAIYEEYKINEIKCYQISTDTDSTSVQFIIVSDPSSIYAECDVRHILFEIFSKTEISKRFDKTNKFWERFNIHKPDEQKVLGLYEVENIDDPCYVTLAVNPKEYFEYFKSELVNKKHKGIKKGSIGMEFKNYAERIEPIKEFDKFQKSKNNSKDVVRISLKKGEMLTHKIKRFYFPNCVVSVPFGHFSLNEIDNFKKEKGRKIEKYFWTEKEKLLELEKSALKKYPRIVFLNNILDQVPKIVSNSIETPNIYIKKKEILIF